MSGTTQSGTPITALKVATTIAATDNVLGVVKNPDGTQEAQQVPVGVIGGAVSEAAGIPAAVQAAENAATTAQAASDASYKNATQAMNDKLGVAGGAAQLDSKAQLLLQGESSLAITPATAASGTTPATPAKLKPLLPLDETATVGNGGNTLGDAVSQAAGAVQATGGDASKTISIAKGATAPRALSDRQADIVSVADFAGTTVTEQFIAADKSGRGKITIPAGTDLALDGSDDLSAANHSIPVTDDKTVVNGQTNNRGNYVHWSAYGSAPDTFNPTVGPEHLKQAGIAARDNGAVIFMNVGDSIGAIASDPCEIAVYPNAIVEMLKRDNPGVKIDHRNMAIGGTHWSDFINPNYGAPDWQDPKSGESWQSCCARQNPDVVILHFLGNDIPNFSPANVYSAVNFWKSQEKVPDIIFGVTYRPSYSNAVDPGESELTYYTEAWQRAFQASVGWLKTYCQANGFGYIDFDRYVASARDGYDPEDVALSMVPALAGTSLPSYENWLELSSDNYANGKWEMPHAPSAVGTYADECTDASLAFDLDAIPGTFIVALNPMGNDGLNITFDCGVYVWFDDASGFITWSYSDGVIDPNTNKQTTNIPIPANVSQSNPVRMCVEAVGARVRVRVFTPFTNNPSWYPNYPLFYYGTGLATVCDILMARPLDARQYSLTMSQIGGKNIKFHRICVGDRSRPGPDVHRYVPSTPCYDLYSEIDGNVQLIGGSNAYHMNSQGVRDTQWRAVRDQVWRVYSYEQNPVLQTGSFAGTNGNFILGKPTTAPGSYLWYDNGGLNIAIQPGSGSAGTYLMAYTNGGLDSTIGQGGYVSISDKFYTFTHFTSHLFNKTVNICGNTLGVAVDGETKTVYLNPPTAAPASPTDGGNNGEVRIDDNYLYICRDGKWRRIAFDTTWS
ncbi:SGNH/GDSL hydrolase family protein [Acetobacter oryzoeni]|uniref:Uncharacterized protein n=1 Tax=Acetobacter oryzoeni TaxID=2500548 RepID=A0A5B9GID3_9PROT|nr:SGNH/GDSL hydrolase family protein [Acetobacter oryzoeni]MCP1202230.1 SGNH/GDSL hydrolase family protein [Acetobacter oryzoeni]QEE85962.1 hypothetical protein EOV40_009745 [Acetobacter oryzoeni]